MPKVPQGEKPLTDVGGGAAHIANIAVRKIEHDSYAQLGKVSLGQARSKALAESVTVEKHSAVAKKAAMGRLG